MEFESQEQIEICFSNSKDEAAAYKMDDSGAALLHYSDAELAASRVNLKERRLLARSCARLDADRSYSLRCLQTDQRLAGLHQSRLEARSARVRTHLTPGERETFARLDATGRLTVPAGSGCYRRPRHLEPDALIGSAQRRLDAAFADVSRNGRRRQRQRRRAPAARPATVGVRLCCNAFDASSSSCSSSSSSNGDSDGASSTESLRRLRRTAVEAATRRPQTVAVQPRLPANKDHRLASRSCHAVFYTGEATASSTMTRRQQQLLHQHCTAAATPRRQQLDKRRWAEAERQKLTSLDRPVREFLRSLADMRV